MSELCEPENQWSIASRDPRGAIPRPICPAKPWCEANAHGKLNPGTCQPDSAECPSRVIPLTFVHPVVAHRIALNVQRPKPWQGRISLTSGVRVSDSRSRLKVAFLQLPVFVQEVFSPEL